MSSRGAAARSACPLLRNTCRPDASRRDGMPPNAYPSPPSATLAVAMLRRPLRQCPLVPFSCPVRIGLRHRFRGSFPHPVAAGGLGGSAVSARGPWLYICTTVVVNNGKNCIITTKLGSPGENIPGPRQHTVRSNGRRGWPRGDHGRAGATGPAVETAWEMRPTVLQ
jgi:hypothetical protein